VPGEEPGYVLRVEIGNEGGFVLPRVPLEITGSEVTQRIDVAVTGETVAFDWRLDERPLSFSVDPDFDIFRKLDPAEIPVTISSALAGDAVVVMPSLASPEKAAAYLELATRLAGDEGTSVALDSDLTPDSLVGRSVFILGGKSENVAWGWLDAPAGIVFEEARIEVDGSVYEEPGQAAFAAFDNALDPGRTVCAIGGNSADAVEKAGYKVIYYGKYSYVTFLDGTKQVAGVIPPPPGPLDFVFETPAAGATGFE
jgi:aminopeptidase N